MVIWEKRVEYGKNIADNLPTQTVILSLLDYETYDATVNGSKANLKYTGTGSYTTSTSGVVNGNKEFTYTIPEREYTITVADVQNANGSTHSDTFTAKYDERFDLSPLNNTYTEIFGVTYTKYSHVQTRKDGVEEGISAQDYVNRELAVQLLSGTHTYHASYVDDSATLTYQFVTTVGDGIPGKEEIIRRGGIITFNFREHVKSVDDEFYAIASLDFDENAAVTQSKVLKVYCKSKSEFQLQFVLNGGSFVSAYTPPKLYDPLDGTTLPTVDDVERDGKIFIGWFTDAEFSGEPVEEASGENGVMTFYAMWRDPEYTIMFNANGGTGEMSDMGATHGAELLLASSDFTAPNDDYVLDGGILRWNTKADGSGETYLEGGITASPRVDKYGVVVLYAEWSLVEYQPIDPAAEVTRGKMSIAEALAECTMAPGTITLLKAVTLKKTIELPDGAVFDGGWDLSTDDISIGAEGNITLFEVAQGISAEIKNLRVHNSRGTTIENSGTLQIEELCVTSSFSNYTILNLPTGKMSIKYASIAGGTQAIVNHGIIVLDHCTVREHSYPASGSGGTSSSAAVENRGTAIINNSTILNNGGDDYEENTVDTIPIQCISGTLYLLNSTIAGNVNVHSAPTIHIANGTLYVFNSLIASNHPTNAFGGNDYSVEKNNSVIFDYDETADRIFSGHFPFVETIPVRSSSVRHLLTPVFNLKLSELKSLSTRIYLDYSDLDNIRLGYGSSYDITSLIGIPTFTDLVTEYLGGGTRDVITNDNRVGASYVELD